jgi:hypothetical protein
MNLYKMNQMSLLKEFIMETKLIVEKKHILCKFSLIYKHIFNNTSNFLMINNSQHICKN